MFNFQPGFVTGVQFKATGQGNTATLNAISSKSIDFLCTLIDVSGYNMAQQGRTGRLAGKLDTAVTISMHFDADNPPYLNPPFIQPGVSGILLYFLSTLSLNRPIQVPVIIEKCHSEDSYETNVKWNVDIKENAYAGLFVWPSS